MDILGRSRLFSSTHAETELQLAAGTSKLRSFMHVAHIYVVANKELRSLAPW